MAEENGWLKNLLDDHSKRLGRIEDKVTDLTGKIYGMAAIVSLAVSIIVGIVVSYLKGK